MNYFIFDVYIHALLHQVSSMAISGIDHQIDDVIELIMYSNV